MGKWYCSSVVKHELLGVVGKNGEIQYVCLILVTTGYWEYTIILTCILPIQILRYVYCTCIKCI